jgi:hypothetical protein
MSNEQSADWLLDRLEGIYGQGPWLERQIVTVIIIDDYANLRAYADEGLSEYDMETLRIVNRKLGHPYNKKAIERMSDLAKDMARKWLKDCEEG